MDGIETTRKLRKQGYTGTIVALTANALVGNDEVFKQHGFDGFIAKPIDLRQLNSILNKFVRDRHPEEAKKYKAQAATTEELETSIINPKLIKVFCRDAEKAIVTMRETSENGDIKLFTTTAHAMKAALANVKEQKASELAGELEDAGINKSMDFIAANTHKFIETLEAIIAAFSPIGADGTDRDENADGDDIADDTDYLKEQLEIVRTACEDYNPEAAYAALDRLSEKSWSALTTAAIEEIRDALYLDSDFDKAAGMITKLFK
jgi:HPt (histidine-containing phosphotransfer) domain-containing protein